MKSLNKILFVSLFVLFAVGSALLIKNYSSSPEKITEKELPYRLKKLEYTEAFVLPQVKNDNDLNTLLKTKPTAAGSIDLVNLVSAITKEAVKSTKSLSEYPLPLLAHWNTGDTSTDEGMTPSYIITLIENGYHILPSWRLNPYWQQQLPDEYYKDSILRAKELNLPLTFIINPIENTLTNESYYFGLPAQDNPNALDINSNILNKLSPLGPDELWSEIGQKFSDTQLLKKIQEWYPNPPLIMFVDNSTPNRLSWLDIGNSSRFVNRYGNSTDNNFKRIVISAHWIEKYRLLHEALRDNLTSKTWKINTRFVSYNPISLDIGNTNDWINKATITNREFSFYPLTADAISVRYFADNSSESINDAIFKLNNLPFVLQQAHKQNSSFSCQLSINDSSYLDTLDKYKGFAQLALWLARPNMIRELDSDTNDKDAIMSRYKALLDSVELIYSDETLQYFWKYGKLVANKNKKIQEASNVPHYYATSNRWFLLDVDINSQGTWNKDENIPVFAIALQIGTKPNRKWLVLAQSFDGDHESISITIPEYKNVTVDSSVKGNFYLIGENTDNQITPLEQMPPVPKEQTTNLVTQNTSIQVTTEQASVEKTVSTQAPAEQISSSVEKDTATQPKAEQITIDQTQTSVEQTVSVQSSIENTTQTTTSIEKTVSSQTSAGSIQTSTEQNFSIPIDTTGAVNVRDFGAVGDGITDDSDAFNQALTTNSKVYVPAGTYRIANYINLLDKTKLLYGQGTIIGDNSYATITTMTNIHDLIIDGLTFSSENRESIYFNDKTIENITIQNCTFIGSNHIDRNTITLVGQKQNQIFGFNFYNNKFINVPRIGVEVLQRSSDLKDSSVIKDIKFIGNIFTFTDGHYIGKHQMAVSLSGPISNTLFQENTINNIAHGIETASALNTRIVYNKMINVPHNVYSNSHANGTYIGYNYFGNGWTEQQGSNMTVEYNIFKGYIKLQGSTNINFRHNQVYAGDYYNPITIDGIENTIESNYIEATGAYGAILQASHSNTNDTNIFKNNRIFTNKEGTIGRNTSDANAQFINNIRLKVPEIEHDMSLAPIDISTNLKIAFNNRPVNVAFIGGSITHGTGTGGNYSKSWAGLTTAWLSTYFTKGVTARNIAISGTNSEYAVFRLERDLGTFIPDILFIEFCVNDPDEQKYVYTYTDALIYKARKLNPKVIIIYIGTTSKSDENSEKNMNEPTGIKYAREICQSNGIHFIDVGTPLWKKVFSENTDITTYLGDTVHPNIAGHQFYADIVTKDLDTYFNTLTLKNKTNSYLHASGYANATIEPVTKVTKTTGGFDNETLILNAGDTFSISFKGTQFGLERLFTPDGGQLSLTVDGNNQKTIDCWNQYSTDTTRVGTAFRYYNLSNSNHTVKAIANNIILNDPTSRKSSTGKICKITGLLVMEPIK